MTEKLNKRINEELNLIRREREKGHVEFWRNKHKKRENLEKIKKILILSSIDNTLTVIRLIVTKVIVIDCWEFWIILINNYSTVFEFKCLHFSYNAIAMLIESEFYGFFNILSW